MNNSSYGNETWNEGFIRLDTTEWYVTLIFGIIIALVTIGANLAAMVDILKKKKLLPFHYYLVNLTAVDMMTGMFAQPNMILFNYYNGNWPLGETWCSFWIFFDVFVNALSFVTLVIISGDRLFAVAYPLKYQQNSTKNRAVTIITISWAIVAVPFLVNFVRFRLMIRHSEPACHFIDYEFITGPGLLSTIIAIYIPPVLITVNYLVLSALMLKRLAKKRAIKSVKVQKVQSGTEASALVTTRDLRSQSLGGSLVPVGASTEVTEQQRLANQRDRKPFLLLAYLIFFFYITCVPMAIFTFMWTNDPSLPDNAPTTFVAVYWLQYLNSMINPFLYAMAEKDFVGGLIRKITGRAS